VKVAEQAQILMEYPIGKYGLGCVGVKFTKLLSQFVYSMKEILQSETSSIK
jgi:hypothetical protein